MKIQKTVAFLCVLALALAFGFTAYAAGTEAERDFASPRCAVTEEMRANFEAKRAEMQEARDKWDALSDAQKEEIYALKDAICDIECRIVDKYLEWGILDKAAANEYKKIFTGYKSEMRMNGRMPFFGIGLRRDRSGKTAD